MLSEAKNIMDMLGFRFSCPSKVFDSNAHSYSGHI